MSEGEEYSVGEEPELAVVDPFTEYGYELIRGHTEKEMGELVFEPGSVAVFNPHSLNVSDQEYKFKERLGKCADNLDKELLQALGSCRDVLYLDEKPDSSHEAILRTLSAFILNKSLTTRDRVIKNNVKLAKDPGFEQRDQGFTRPRFLFLCPFKNTAYRLVSYMTELWSKDDLQVEQKKRFSDEYGKALDSDGEGLEEDLSRHPSDYQHLFSGNIEDCFRIGVKMTRKALKLYADFYSADILLASPLGLKLIIDGQDFRSKDDRKKVKVSADRDFLSSIECVITDQSDVICMQNWEHLVEIFEKLNLLPTDSHGCDFSRVMSVFLDDRSKFVRQSVFFSAFGFPELLNLFKSGRNVFGAVKFEPETYESILRPSSIKPEFHIISDYTDVPSEAEARYKHFAEMSLAQNHTCIFVSSYFEFLRLKAHLTRHEASFEAISEYTDHKGVTRARSRFFNGHARILLLTERFWFYHRFLIKGIKRMLFYSVPMYPLAFKEFVEMIAVRDRRVKAAPIIVLSQLDRKKVERVLGIRSLEKII